MPTFLLIICILAAVGVPVGFIIHTFTSRKKAMNDPNSYILEAPEPVIESATIIELFEETNRYTYKSHCSSFRYCVRFLLQDSSELVFSVPFEVFSQLSVGQIGDLAMQNEQFLGFDVRYDSPI
ncbi:DUF2500 family protein [Paludicola sp. MB14-C6]|uniref:DUF2500 family protein n=1 Tax=Paludihabitans sp. MB14-C6 TaxID=3070656 RepID=UPI0027DC097D|nr:DUF2500 family protein [Paludicola sp. MB14-C6]WMJ24401.1 DUF2500 family protein [Paludicola sp. MB14-C6]